MHERRAVPNPSNTAIGGEFRIFRGVAFD